MKNLMLAAILTLSFALSACNTVEEFYAARCNDMGGTWSSQDGCTEM